MQNRHCKVLDQLYRAKSTLVKTAWNKKAVLCFVIGQFHTME